MSVVGESDKHKIYMKKNNAAKQKMFMETEFTSKNNLCGQEKNYTTLRTLSLFSNCKEVNQLFYSHTHN